MQANPSAEPLDKKQAVAGEKPPPPKRTLIMDSWTISKLARACGLSRSTLLYYDRIGLFRPSGRSAAGYRRYSEEDRRRLERICSLRSAGLALTDIQTILNSKGKRYEKVLERRFQELGNQLLDLKTKQRLLASMLKTMASGGCSPVVDRKMWVEMLRAAGMDERAMCCWHSEFEHRAPQAHHEFLLSIGIPKNEIEQIRRWSRERRGL